jgi:hypothetical protein
MRQVVQDTDPTPMLVMKQMSLHILIIGQKPLLAGKLDKLFSKGMTIAHS